MPLLQDWTQTGDILIIWIFCCHKMDKRDACRHCKQTLYILNILNIFNIFMLSSLKSRLFLVVVKKRLFKVLLFLAIVELFICLFGYLCSCFLLSVFLMFSWSVDKDFRDFYKIDWTNKQGTWDVSG